MERGIGFLTRKDPWCVPMLVGTGILAWLQEQGLRSPREAVMFRGMSGSEHSHKLHTRLELYRRLDLPTFNPVLSFTKEEIIEVVKSHYGLPLNPIYQHMDRTYCICCYTSDARRQNYSQCNFPEVCTRYYGQIEKMLFDSGLIEKARLRPEHQTREEKLDRHGFVHWNRIKAQNIIGAVRRCGHSGTLVYRIRKPAVDRHKTSCSLERTVVSARKRGPFLGCGCERSRIPQSNGCSTASIAASVLWSVFVADATTASPRRFVLTDACSVVGAFE